MRYYQPEKRRNFAVIVGIRFFSFAAYTPFTRKVSRGCYFITYFMLHFMQANLPLCPSRFSLAGAVRTLMVVLLGLLLPRLAAAATPVLKLQGTVAAGSSVDVTAFVDQIEILNAGTGVVVASAVPNMGFETTGSLGAGLNTFAYNPTGTGWAFNAQSGIAANGSGFGNPTAPEGTHVALLQSTGGGVGSLSQMLPSLPAGRYVVRVQLAQRNYGAANQGVRLSIDNAVVGSYVPADDQSFHSYTSAVFSVGDVLRFEGTGSPTVAGADVTAFIDSVQLVNTATSAVARAVVNPGFETTGSLGAGLNTFAYNPTGTGWAFNAQSGIAANGSGFGNPTAPEGTHMALLQQTGTAQQTLAGLAAGRYQVKLYAAQRTSTPSNQGVRVLLNGVVLGTITPTLGAAQAFTVGTFSVATPVVSSYSATGGGNTLTLTGTNLQGATAITFIGAGGSTVSSGFAVNAAGDQLTGVAVPASFRNGFLTVTTPGGTTVPVLFSRGQSAAAGAAHTATVRADGTLWTWGSNDYGQLGNNALGTSSSTPVQVGTGTNWVSVAAGYAFTLALRADGTLWAWGENTSGQLGRNNYTHSPVPVQVGTATNWVSVAAGNDHTIGLQADGTLWAWGQNSSGQLGLGNSSGITTPTRVGTATNWVSVTAGPSYSLGLQADGTLWAWGQNGSGQLGLGTTANVGTPTRVGTASTWVSVDAGASHAGAVRADGTLWTWGNNNNGQLGLGNTNSSYLAPTRVGTATNWASVSAGEDFTVGVQTNGTLWAWGRNGSGQLGLGNTTDANVPTQVGTGTSWAGAAAGKLHAVAEQGCRNLWAWADNTYGQLGDGTTSQRTAPVLVYSYIRLLSFAPSSAVAGATVVATGQGLLGISSLIVNGTPVPLANISNNTATSFSFVVPNGTVAGTTTVAAGCGTASSTGFTVTSCIVPATRKAALTLGAAGTGSVAASTFDAGSTSACGSITATARKYVAVFGTVGENGTLTLTAPAGTTFAYVDFASYGNPTDAGNGSYTKGSCHATNSQSTVEIALLGQTGTVNIPATNAAFGGDPCPGTAKLLAVRAFCAVGATPTATLAYTCAELGDQPVLLTLTAANGASAVVPAVVAVAGPPAATLTSLSTAAVNPGATVTATGTNLIGATALTVNGVAAPITGLTATGFSFVVPNTTLATGTVALSVPCAQTPTLPFAVLPAVSSFTPTHGVTGTSVTVTGTRLDNATGITLNGVPVPGVIITANTSTSLTFAVPAGATSGPIAVSTANGTGAASTAIFNIDASPALASLSPWQAQPGTLLTLTGTYLQGATAITFSGAAGTKAVSSGFAVNAAGTQITGVVVPAGAQTGPVTVTTPAGMSIAALFTRAQTLAATFRHTAVIRPDGTLWTYGDNAKGQLGQGNTSANNTPAQVGPGTTWVSVSAGYGHTMAIRTDGTLWAWGSNSNGQLGLPGTVGSNVLTPTQVGTATNWASVSAGYTHTAAVQTNGTLWTWGSNASSQLGQGNTTQTNEPTRVGTGTNWASVAAGYEFTVAVQANGTLWACGRAGDGQLGLGSTSTRPTVFTQVGSASTWVSASANYFSAFGVQADGTLWGWGSNPNFKIGLPGNQAGSILSPTRIGTATNWTSVATGQYHTVGLQADNTLWAWGQNDLGQLGLGNSNNANAPTRVGTATRWLSAVAGAGYSTGEQDCRAVWAWGDNGYRQLGDASTGYNTPQLVYNPVAILSFSPANAMVGSTVLVSGRGLNDLSYLTVNGARVMLANVSNSTSTSFRFVVPLAATATGTTTVEAGCGTASSTGLTVVPCITPAVRVPVLTLGAAGTGSVTVGDFDGGHTSPCGAIGATLRRTGAVYDVVPENGTLTLTAPAGTAFTSVDFASFGNATGSNGNYTLGNCHASLSQLQVERALLGQTGTVSIPASTSYFGDPCSGTAKTLTVRATYTSINAATTLAYSCAEVGSQAVLLTLTDANNASLTVATSVTVVSSPTATITSVSPTQARAGTTVTVVGTNLSGATALTINGASAPLLNLTATGFTFVVPATAGATGNLVLSLPCAQTLTRAFVVPPTIASFTPTSGGAGTQLTITGSGLNGTTAVTFTGTSNNVVTTGFTVNAAGTSISGIVVPAGAQTGTLTVTTASGTSAASSQVFTLCIVPAVRSVTATLGPDGTIRVPASAFDAGSTSVCGTITYTIAQSGSVYNRVATGGTLSLTIPPGTVFTSVDFASYGNSTGSNGNYVQGTCHSEYSQQVAERYLLGRSGTVSIPIISALFGTPCTGHLDFAVRASYASASPTPELEYSCADLGPHAVTVTMQSPDGSSVTLPTTLTILAPPTTTITSVSPTQAPAGATVTVVGTNLGGATTVTVNGASAPVLNLTATGFTFVVPATATATGSLVLNVPCAQTLTQPFAVLPVISSFTPTNGATGTVVTLTGSALNGATAVTFTGTSNNVVTNGFTVNAAGTSISGIVVPAGAQTGTLTVTTASGTSAASSQVFGACELTPVVRNLTVALAANGTATVAATDFDAGTTSTCGPLTITARKYGVVYGTAGENGTLTLTAPAGTVFLAVEFASYGNPTDAGNGNYTLGNCHAASSRSVVEAALLGQSGTVDIGASNGNFGGDPCGGTAKSLAVRATYGLAGTTATPTATLAYTCAELGVQSVQLTFTSTTGFATTTNATVTIVAPPTATLTSVGPAAAAPGATITVVGTNLGGAAALTVNGASAPILNLTATGFTFVVPNGVTATGNLALSLPCGQVLTEPFTALVPAIVSFTPTSGPVGTSVTISGTDLGNATGLTLNGVAVPLANITANTGSSLTFTVPTGATAGPLAVATANGTSAASSQPFAVLPVISSFTPTRGVAGTVVALAGSGLNGATAVTFTGASNNVVTTSFTVNATGTGISGIVVPAGAQTGALTVTTASGTSPTSSSVFTLCSVVPVAQNATLTLGATGTGSIAASAFDAGSTSICGGTLTASARKGGVAYGVANEHDMLTLTAPAGYVFTAVEFASYGNPTDVGNGNYALGYCHSSLSQTVVETALLGQSGTVSIEASNSNFGGDPCNGTAKSLAVRAIYGLVGATTTPTATLVYSCAELGAQPVLLTLTDAAGASVSVGATVTVAPPPTATLVSLSQQSATWGTTVAVVGTNLGGATALTVNGASAPILNLTATGFTFVVPNAANATGDLVLTLPCGQDLTAPFATTAPALPMLTAIVPAAELVGLPVLLTGSGFTANSTVSFGGVAATAVTYLSANSLRVVVPTSLAAGSAAVVVTNGAGSNVQSPAFEVLALYSAVTAGCLTTQPYLATGDGQWHYLRATTGQVVAALQDTRAALGTVSVGFQVLGAGSTVRQDASGRKYLDRNWHLMTTGGAFAGQTVNLRFYGLNTELNRLKAADANTNLATLKATQYAGPNEDCDLANDDFVNGEVRRLAAPAAQPGPGQNWFMSEVAVTDHFSEFFLGSGNAPLPVELVAFTATKQGDAVALAWRTASEKNSARFEVERSADGTRFERIGTVAAAGSSTAPRDYTFPDPLASRRERPQTLYYRLRQVDQDGTDAYSGVRSVVLEAKAGLVLFPNPTNGAATLTGATPGTVVQVVDALGRTVLTATTDDAGTAALALPAGLATGVYVVRAGTTALRLTVQ
jgi:alpha-tubulin suppressor-like RCC1 family protein